MSRGRKASLPRVTQHVPVPGALSVVLTLEDDPAYVFDLSGRAGPELIREQLCAAVLISSTHTNGLRRTSSVKNVARSLSAFLKWVDLVGDQGLAGGDQIKSLEDLTPFHLRTYEDHLSSYTRHTSTRYYFHLTAFIRLSAVISPATRSWAAKRRRSELPPTKPVQRYTREEFVAIRNAARRTVIAAHRRITEAFALAHQYEADPCADPVRARALNEVLVHGKPQSREGLLSLGASDAAIAAGGGELSSRHWLFMSGSEIYAAAVLIVCDKGLNLSPVVTAPLPVEHEPGVVQLNLDKPRRGSNARFWPEILVDDPKDVIDAGRGSKAATTIRLITEATEPARVHLGWQGQSAARLLVYNAGSSGICFGIPVWQPRRDASWVPDGINIEFRRLRHSVPDEGVSKEPTNHSPETYLHYVRIDPESLDQEREKAAVGIQQLMDHARAGLAVRMLADNETKEETDSLVVNCSDPSRRPDSGQACTTGFYSFLDCLECPNAATAPRLLARQMAAKSVLEELRDGMGTSWERKFARHYYTLVAVIERHTTTEQEAAISEVSQHTASIVSALRLEVPK